MNIFQEQYRNLSEKSDFYKNERLVFIDGAPKSEPDAAPDKPAPKPDAKPEGPVEPMTPKGFEAFQENFNKHIKVLEESKPDIHKNRGEGFKNELEGFKKTYQEKVDKFEKEKDDKPKEAAANVVRGGVKGLINKIREHLTEDQKRKLDNKGDNPNGEPGYAQEGKDNPNEAVPLNKAHKAQALALLIAKYKIVNKDNKLKIQELIPKLGLTAEQVKKMMPEEKGVEGTLTLTPAQAKIFFDGMKQRILKYEPARGKMIHEQLTDDDLTLKAGISEKAADIIEELFDNDDDPLRVYLVQRYDFKVHDDEGGLMLTKDDGNAVHIKTVEQLTDYLPLSAQNNFRNLLKSQNPSEEYKEVLEKEGENGLKAMKALQELNKIDPRTVEAFRGMGLTKMIPMLIQIYKLFQEAMKTGDFKSLEDGLVDFQMGRNPMDRMKSSKSAYENKINGTDTEKGVQDTGNLIALYNEPYGAEAKKLFTNEKGAEVPYRIQLKGIIQARLENDLGVSITEIKTETATRTKILCTRGKETFNITLERSGGQTFATREDIIYDTDGKEETKVGIAKTEVKDTTTGDKSLAFVLFQKSPGTPGEPGAEKVEKEVFKGGTPLETAIPQERAKASKEYKAGINEYGDEKETKSPESYEKALTHFKTSYETVASPNSHLMIVKALAKLERKPEALHEAQSTLIEAEKTGEKYKDTKVAAQEWVDELTAELKINKEPEVKPAANPPTAPEKK